MASGTGNDAAAHSPLEQFEIKRIVPLEIFGYDISFTNSSMWMILTLAAACAFLYFARRGGGLIPTRLQSAAELVYEFIEKTVSDICGPEAKKFFPFIFTLFTFILAANTLGLLPGSFTVTSHLSVTLALALLVFTIVTVVGFARNGLVSHVSADVSQDQKTAATFYTIHIKLPPDEVARLEGLRLVPGMPVEAFVQTSPRTVMSYLVRPLHNQLMRAFRER